jgi:hypothetical protein
LLLLVVASAVACDSGTTGPTRLRGEFVLTLVNSSPPPVIIGRLSGTYTALTNGTLSIDSDTVLQRTLEFLDVTKDPSGDSSFYATRFQYVGRYRRAGDTLFITYPPQESVAISGQDTGFVSAAQVTIGLRPTLRYGSQRLVYERR